MQVIHTHPHIWCQRKFAFLDVWNYINHSDIKIAIFFTLKYLSLRRNKKWPFHPELLKTSRKFIPPATSNIYRAKHWWPYKYLLCTHTSIYRYSEQAFSPAEWVPKCIRVHPKGVRVQFCLTERTAWFPGSSEISIKSQTVPEDSQLRYSSVFLPVLYEPVKAEVAAGVWKLWSIAFWS